MQQKHHRRSRIARLSIQNPCTVRFHSVDPTHNWFCLVHGKVRVQPECQGSIAQAKDKSRFRLSKFATDLRQWRVLAPNFVALLP